jgi:peroxiredoxin Q/BCP
MKTGEMPNVGAAAPEFCLESSLKKKICLSEMRGKWVVLYFYPKDETPGCTVEAIDFTKAIGDIEKLGAVVLGVSRDTVESHCKFAERHKLAVPLLSDPGHAVHEAYGAWRPKTIFGKEVLGAVRCTFLVDPEGKIAHVWPKVSVFGHIEEVRAALEERARASGTAAKLAPASGGN